MKPPSTPCRPQSLAPLAVFLYSLKKEKTLGFMSIDSAPVLTEIWQHNSLKFSWTETHKVEPGLDQFLLHNGFKTVKIRALYTLI